MKTIIWSLSSYILSKVLTDLGIFEKKQVQKYSYYPKSLKITFLVLPLSIIEPYTMTSFSLVFY